jgi:hypothetical protein
MIAVVLPVKDFEREIDFSGRSDDHHRSFRYASSRP